MMAQTYAQFKAFVLEGLWSTNNTELTANIDNLIRMANNELDQLTRSWQARQDVQALITDTQDVNLTSVYAGVVQAIRSVINIQSAYRRNPKLTQTTVEDLYTKRAQNPSGEYLPYYAVHNANGILWLRLIGPFATGSAGQFMVNITRGVPDYAVTDSSWMEDLYQPLYLYTIYKHCAIFLREDERIQEFSGLQAEQFELGEQDDKHNLQFGGSPLYMRPHRTVP